MAYIERSDEEFIAAFERWLERHPAPDAQMYMVGDKTYSAKELVELFKTGKDQLYSFERLRAIAKEQNFDPVEALDNTDNKNQCDQCDQCDQCQGMEVMPEEGGAMELKPGGW